MIKFSIIIPVYNTSSYIDKCLKSIFDQTNNNYEIICVNDGSTDNSLDILNNYKDKITIVNQNNLGLSQARNNGLKQAKGEYILFLDSDDYLEKELLEKLEEVLVDKPDLVRFGLTEVNENNFTKVPGPIFNNLSGIDAFKEIVKNKYVEPAWLYLYNKDYYFKNNFKFMPGVYHEDFGLLPKVIVTAEKVTSISYPGYNYVKREGSIINDPTKTNKKLNDYLIQGEELLNYKTDSKEFYSYIANSLISASNRLIDKKLKKDYINRLKELNIEKYLLKDNIKRKIKMIYYKIKYNL